MTKGLTEIEWWEMIHAYYDNSPNSSEVYGPLHEKMSRVQEDEWGDMDKWPAHESVNGATGDCDRLFAIAAAKLEELRTAQRIETDGAAVTEMLNG